MSWLFWLWKKQNKNKKFGNSFVLTGDISGSMVTVNGNSLNLASWLQQNISNYGSALFASGLPTPKIWYGVAQTNSSGIWSIVLPPNMFSTIPLVFPQALSSDATSANSASATLTSSTQTSATGLVTLPNTITVGGSPVKAAGANIVVFVLVIGY